MKQKRPVFTVPVFLQSICFSLFVSLFLFSDRSVEVTSAEQMLEAIHGTQVNFLCFFFVCIIFYSRLPRCTDRRAQILSWAGALFFTCCDFFGYHIYHYDSLFRLKTSVFYLLLDLTWFIGAFLLFKKLLNLLFFYVTAHSVKAKSHLFFDKYLGSNRRSFLISFSLLMGVSILLLTILYPGLTNFDSFVQISEGLGILPFSDNHPFLHTLQMKYVIRLGRFLFGSTAAGIAFYTFFQSVLVNLAVAGLLHYMARRGIHPVVRLLSFLYFVLHPAVACYSIFLWKDIWLSYFLMLYALILTEVAVCSDHFFQNNRHLIGTALVILGFLFSKNTGIIILIGTLPFLLLSAKKYWKKIILLFGCILLVFGLTRSIVIPMLGIQKGGVGEPLSAPLQQIARTVSKAGDRLTEDQKARIREILPYEELPELYIPTLSDPVKSSLKENIFSAHPMRYAGLWLELGIQHPRIYLESLLANSAGYWYPGIYYWVVEDTWYFTDYLSGDWFFYHLDSGDPDAETYDLSEDAVSRGTWLRHYFVHLFILLQHAPLFSFLLSAAFPCWVFTTLFLICILKRKYRLLLPMLVPFLTFLICILSPVFAEYRYIFPAVVTIPLIAAFTLQDDCTVPDSGSAG